MDIVGRGYTGVLYSMVEPARPFYLCVQCSQYQVSCAFASHLPMMLVAFKTKSRTLSFSLTCPQQ